MLVWLKLKSKVVSHPVSRASMKNLNKIAVGESVVKENCQKVSVIRVLDSYAIECHHSKFTTLDINC